MAVEFRETLFAVDQAWLDANQRVITTQPSGDLAADGYCGRCHDQTWYPIDLEPVATAAIAGPRVSLEVTRMFRCRCARGHDGRPGNVASGCGAYWFARVSGAPGGYTLSPAPPEFVAGAQAVDQARKEEAGLVQRTAEKWLGAITALLALFSVGGAALTANSVAKLNTAGRLFAAVAAVLAVLSGAIAVIYGYRAAYGWLALAPTGTESDARALASPARGIQDRVEAFRLSIPAAGISLGLAVVALLVIWFAPVAGPRSPLVKVSYGRGNGQITVCGTLLDSASTAVVRLMVQDGATASIRVIPRR